MSGAISHSYTTKATCLTCNRLVAGSVKSTGNFYSHIDKKHPELSERCRAYSRDKYRSPTGMKIINIRRPAIKPNTNSTLSEVQIEPSTRRPKIMDGKYFELVKKWSNGKIAAKCRQCHRNISAHISNTGNLFSHIRGVHSEYIEECRAYCSNRSSEARTMPNHKKVIEIIEHTKDFSYADIFF